MDKKTKILYKIFNAKVFFAIVCVVAIVVVIGIKIQSDQKQKKIEERLTNFKMESYKGDEMVSVGKALEHCNLKSYDLEGIVVGIDRDGEGLCRYYIKDRGVVMDIVDKLNNINLSNMTDSAEEFIDGKVKWDILLYPSKEAYAFRIFGQDTRDEKYCLTRVRSVEKKNYSVESKKYYTELWKVFGSETQLLYNSDIEEYIKEVIEEYVKPISIDNAIRICSQEELDYGNLFFYEHTVPEDGEVDVEGKGYYMSTAIYKFPVEDTGGYLLLEKEDYVTNDTPCIDVIRLELHNSDGEYINALESDKGTIKSFVESMGE